MPLYQDAVANELVYVFQNAEITFALVEAIRKSKGRLTYRQLHDRAADVLKARKFEQVPQLEGRTSHFDAPLFSA